MNNFSNGLIYEGGCHSAVEFIPSVPDLTHQRLTERAADWLIK